MLAFEPKASQFSAFEPPSAMKNGRTWTSPGPAKAEGAVGSCALTQPRLFKFALNGAVLALDRRVIEFALTVVPFLWVFAVPKVDNQ